MMRRVFYAIAIWLALVLPAYAQVSFVNQSTNASPNSTLMTSFPLTVPVGEMDNDGMVACVGWTNTSALATITPPAGWTLLRTGSDTSCYNVAFACYSRVASSEPASYSWGFSGSGGIPSGFILDYRGTAPGLVDVSAVLSGAGDTATAPSITTTGANERLVTAFASVGPFISSPVGLTVRTQASPNTGNAPFANGYDANMTTAGPSGAKTVKVAAGGPTEGPACKQWVGINLALIPSPAPPPSPVSNVTVTGTVANFYGFPCVSCHVDLYALNPTLVSNGNGTLVETGPVRVETNSNGVFSASVFGSVTAAIYVEETQALFKTTLPSSGTITLAQIQAAQPNVVSVFPPTSNLNMGGNHFINMSGGQAIGDSVAVGLGLGGGAQIFSTSGTYTFPTGATLGEAYLLGGGGGGGGGNSGGSNGGGGGGGGTVERCMIYPGNGPATLTVGGGGVGGAAVTNGSAGQSTVVAQGTATCTAPGGNLGTHGSGGGPGNGGATGSDGTVTGAAHQLSTTDGVAGANGTSGAGGVGGTNGAPGGGGDGGAPSSGVGTAGGNGLIVLWAY